ncbi:MAG: type VI secretion system baseplate subunit TssF [Verrucomicrobiia bacterium]|jgi:type VI secretion system protein ImpG
MDERLLELYNTELHHLRQVAGEFARENPKIAARLALDRDAKEICPDPFVERLLEGFAFLAARVHLKIEAEFPRFTQSLLETVFPQYLCPTPSMAIVRFEPDYQESALAEGYRIERGTALHSLVGKKERTACEYRTAHEITLWPIQIIEARYFTRDLAQLGLPTHLGCKAAFRIRLLATGGLNFKDIGLGRLPMYLRGDGDLPVAVYEQIFGHRQGLLLQSVRNKTQGWQMLPAAHIQRGGFSEQEALLPVSPRGFEGYRLLREYFAFPQRFLFVELAGLAEAVQHCEGDQVDLVIPLNEQNTQLEGRVDASCFELFCTPAINLFPKRTDSILLADRFSEFHVVVDRTRTLDFEVFGIEKVMGYGALTGEEQEFRPFYKAQDVEEETGAFYTMHRVPRLLTDKERRFGRRSNYTGSDVYLSLVDAKAAPYRTDLRELGITALCTNRHLPIQMPLGVGSTDFSIVEISAPVTSVRCLGTPSVPIASPARGETAWRIISHLKLNYLSLLDVASQEGAVALRQLLELYADADNKVLQKQIEGIRSTRSYPDVQRVETPGPVAFARGLRIEVLFDEQAFEGVGVFVLGSVLEQFFAKYVSINSFTRTVIKTEQRGEIMRWPAQTGKRQII